METRIQPRAVLDSSLWERYGVTLRDAARTNAPAAPPAAADENERAAVRQYDRCAMQTRSLFSALRLRELFRR